MHLTFDEFNRLGREISARAGVLNGQHNYFVSQAERLYQTCRLFNLFQPQGDVLEIGPFYGYIPFILRPQCRTYTVIESPDPAVPPLEPLYRENRIAFHCVDFVDVFGPIVGASRRLALPDEAFDLILCWASMEHFFFNPVPFTRELYRILRPGGRVCVTVPNKASFQNIVALLTGRFEEKQIQAYFEFENYRTEGKPVFYGFHWREYTPGEFRLLFAGSGFSVLRCSTVTSFHNFSKPRLGRRLLRAMCRVGSRLLPRYGPEVFLEATKK